MSDAQLGMLRARLFSVLQSLAQAYQGSQLSGSTPPAESAEGKATKVRFAVRARRIILWSNSQTYQPAEVACFSLVPGGLLGQKKLAVASLWPC